MITTGGDITTGEAVPKRGYMAYHYSMSSAFCFILVTISLPLNSIYPHVYKIYPFIMFKWYRAHPLIVFVSSVRTTHVQIYFV